MQKIQLNSSNAIKGIAAILIILHHISQNVSNPFYLYIFQWFGTISVGLFFFFSGYGLTYQLYNKKNYLDSFWEKRLSKLLIPFLLCNIIYLLFNSILFHNNYSFQNILFYFIGIKLINPIAWYIIAILWLYIGFWASYKFLNNRYLQLLSISIFIFAFIGWCKLNHLATFVSVFSFPLGILYAQNINKIKIKYTKYIIGILSIIFCYLFYEASLMQYINNIRNVSICILECLCFSIIIILSINKYEIKNKFLIFLGSISLEIYLIHGLFFNLIYKNNELLSVLIIIPLSILSAYLFKSLHIKIENEVSNLLNKHLIRKSEKS